MSLNFQSLVSQFFEVNLCFFNFSQIFQWQTLLVVRWPLLFLATPPLLTIFISMLQFSFYFFNLHRFCLAALTLHDLHVETTNETLQVFLPDEMESLTNLKEVFSNLMLHDFNTLHTYESLILDLQHSILCSKS